MSNKKIELSIYGDNILECERMFDLIERGFISIQEVQVDISHKMMLRHELRQD